MYKRQLLQKYQQDIIDDLDVAYIYDELFAKHVISAEEYNLIRSIVSNCYIFLIENDRVLFLAINQTHNSNNQYFCSPLLLSFLLIVMIYSIRKIIYVILHPCQLVPTPVYLISIYLNTLSSKQYLLRTRYHLYFI